MKRITKLTKTQEARLPEWRDKWINIGLQTGDADWERFERGARMAYKKAAIPFPDKVIRVQSPIVGALVASMLITPAISTTLRHFKIRNAVYSAVGSAVDSAVESAVDSAVRSAVRSAVYSAVHSAVHSEVGSAVHSAVYSAVHSAVVQKPLKTTQLLWHGWLGGQFWVGGWYGAPSFVSFFTEVCGLKLEQGIQERADAYRDICESVNYVWPNTEFVIVCDRPKHIRRKNGQLHSDQGKAIEYKDGWGLFALDGVVIKDEKMYWDIVKQSLTMAELFAIPDADVRAVALKYSGERILEEGAELLDEHRTAGKLFLITKTKLNEITEHKEIYMLRMECPSTGRVFVEAVEPAYAKQHPYAMHCQAFLSGIPVELYSRIRNHG